MSLNTHYSLSSGCHNYNGKLKISGNKFEKSLKIFNFYKKKFGKEILISGSDDKTVIVWDVNLQNPLVKRLAGHHGPINHLSFSPNGIIFVSASFDKTLRIWSLHNNTCLAVLKGHISAVYILSFSRDSKWVISGSKDSTLQVWDMKKKKRAF